MRIDRRQLLLATGVIAAAPRLLRAADAVLKAVRLRTEGIDHPIGLELAQPRFSWALESAARNTRQAAYRITAASSARGLASGTADLWDSARVASDRCFDVAYAGRGLRSGQRAWWRVQVWDEAGRISAPSEATWFEMGLLHSSDWRAQWLAIETQEEKDDRAAGVQWVWGDCALDPRPQRFCLRCSLPSVPVLSLLLVSDKDALLGIGVGVLA